MRKGDRQSGSQRKLFSFKVCRTFSLVSSLANDTTLTQQSTMKNTHKKNFRNETHCILYLRETQEVYRFAWHLEIMSTHSKVSFISFKICNMKRNFDCGACGDEGIREPSL